MNLDQRWPENRKLAPKKTKNKIGNSATKNRASKRWERRRSFTALTTVSRTAGKGTKQHKGMNSVKNRSEKSTLATGDDYSRTRVRELRNLWQNKWETTRTPPAKLLHMTVTHTMFQDLLHEVVASDNPRAPMKATVRVAGRTETKKANERTRRSHLSQHERK